MFQQYSTRLIVKNRVSVLFYVARRRDDIYVSLLKIALRSFWYSCRRKTKDASLTPP